MEKEKTKRLIDFDRTGFDNEELVTIYKAIAKPRLIEEKMLILLRQGKISKWFSGWGQEGISVGSAYAMKEEEMMLMASGFDSYLSKPFKKAELFKAIESVVNLRKD